MTSDMQVVGRVREFLNLKSTCLENSVVFVTETEAHLYYIGTDNIGVKIDLRVRKDDGQVRARVTGFENWHKEPYDCDCFRICTHCKELMVEGYVIDNGTEYFCSDNHLQTVYLMTEYLDMYNDGEGDSYWTEW